MLKFKSYENMWNSGNIVINFTGDLTHYHNMYPKFEIQILVKVFPC